jgi:2-polyprenyl-6-hydroxyphenyl methylase/3-demethylubiquinone-9 3-methyltransferase
MDNVDELEIRKFEALAARWWDPDSEFKPLHEINPLRMSYISRKVNPAGKKVLDIGCGGGILAEAMAHHGASVTAIDMADASLHSEQFDIVTCLEMLEHVPEPAKVIQACYDLVKPGGTVFFSTINRNPKSYLFAIVGAEYILNLLPRGTHDYARFIKPSELAAFSRDSKLDLQDQIGMAYNPLTRKYSLEANVDVNYIACYTRAETPT